MIEFQQERDRRRFLKPNIELAKQAELEAEKQRVEQGRVATPRFRLIDKVYQIDLTRIR